MLDNNIMLMRQPVRPLCDARVQNIFFVLIGIFLGIF